RSPSGFASGSLTGSPSCGWRPSLYLPGRLPASPPAPSLNDDCIVDDLRALLDMRGGLGHRGRISYGGACRLLPAADGWVALTLARPDDIALVPALVSRDHADQYPWAAVAEF